MGAATQEADARAFAALMRHIKEVDGRDHTVLMMQVENEVGVLGDSRDHSTLQTRPLLTGAGAVAWLFEAHRDALYPDLRALVGGEWRQDRGHLGGGLWRYIEGGRDLHGLAVCAIHSCRGGQRARLPTTFPCM
jgi:hypothetical protein